MGKEAFDPSLFGRFLNCGPTVLAVSQHRGVPDIITLSWVSPVSAAPPLVMLAVSPRRYSHGLIAASGEVTINVPPWSTLEETFFCGTTSGRDVDKFAECAFTPLPSRRVQPPGIAECIATLECGVRERFVAGDHTLFIVEVLAITADEDVVDDVLGAGGGDVRTIHHLGGNLFAPLGGPARRAGRDGG